MVNYKRRYTDEKLVYYLRKLALELGRTPYRADMDMAKGYPNSSTYQTVFGSWTKAVIIAGLTPNRIGIYSDEELIQILKGLIYRNENEVTERSINRLNHMPRYGTYRKHFGSFDQAKSKASPHYS